MTHTPLAFMASGRNRRRGKRRIGGWLAGVQAVLLLLLSGLMHAQESPAADADAVSGYQLGPRDSISVTVFNHPDLSGEYVLDGDGRFSMPLIGVVDADGKTPVELEEALVNRFSPDYLINPRISIEVRNYRPYYLIGEVQNTGSFPYVAGITYLTAIAMAGGYTYRAKKDVVFVIRGNDPEQEEIKLDANEKVQPGDIIRVAERLF
jgi:polysaccharide export outer membrane protein